MCGFGVGRTRYCHYRRRRDYSWGRGTVWILHRQRVGSISIRHKVRARIHTARLVHWDSVSKSWSASERLPWMQDCLRDREVPRPAPLTIYLFDDGGICDPLISRPDHFLVDLVAVAAALSD